MTNTTLPTLTTAAAIGDDDIFLVRVAGQTSDQQLKGSSLLAYVTAAIGPVSVTADQITDATTVGKQVLRASTTAEAQNALGGSAVGKGLYGAATTAAAQNLLEAGAVGLQIFKTATTADAKNILDLSGNNSGDVTIAGENYLSINNQLLSANPVNLAGTNVTGTLPLTKGGLGATTTAAAINALGAGAAGSGIFQASTTAEVHNLLEGTAPGLGIYKAATTAAQQDLLEAGAVGLQVWKTATTAAAQSALGGGTFGKGIFAAATTAAAADLFSGAFFTSAGFATTAQATAATSDGTIMSPATSKKLIEDLLSAGFIQIAQQTPTGTTAHFTSIPQTYNDLVLVATDLSCTTASRYPICHPGPVSTNDIGIFLKVTGTTLTASSFISIQESQAVHFTVQAAAAVSHYTLTITGYSGRNPIIQLSGDFNNGAQKASMLWIGVQDAGSLTEIQNYWNNTGNYDGSSTLTLYAR